MLLHSSVIGQIYPRPVKFPPTNEGRAESNGLQSQNLSNLNRCSAIFCWLGGWVWIAESAQLQIFWYSCSPHPSSALVHAEEALLPAVPTITASGWTPLSTDSSWPVLPPHLTFLHQVSKLFYAAKNTNSSVSSKLCLRTEKNKQHNLLFWWENTPVFTLSWSCYQCVEDFLKAFTRKLQPQQHLGVHVLPVIPRKFQHYEAKWKWEAPTTWELLMLLGWFFLG